MTKITKRLREQIFHDLGRINAHPSINSTEQLVVWTQGYKTQEAYDIERYLMQFGVVLVAQKFDKVCGKTANTFEGI